MLVYLCSTIKNNNMSFNKNFYTPNTFYTKEMAEQRLFSLGYKNFSFKSLSYTNGASFYFLSEDGKTIRVSDHHLTGKRAFETIEVSIKEVKTMSVVQPKVSDEFAIRLAAAIAAKNN